MPKYEIAHATLGGWINTWSDDNGKPVTFETKELAETALKEYLSDETDHFEGGVIDYAPDPEDYKVREAQSTRTLRVTVDLEICNLRTDQLVLIQSLDTEALEDLITYNIKQDRQDEFGIGAVSKVGAHILPNP